MPGHGLSGCAGHCRFFMASALIIVRLGANGGLSLMRF